MSAQVFFSQILATSDKPVCPHWHERKALSFQFTRPSTDTYFVLRQKTEPRFNISFPCYYYLDSSRWQTYPTQTMWTNTAVDIVSMGKYGVRARCLKRSGRWHGCNFRKKTLAIMTQSI